MEMDIRTKANYGDGKRSNIEPNFIREDDSDDEDRPLIPKERHGDVISSHRALLTLMKGFVGSGCLSLPYAWKQGGLWMSFALQFVISALNWYSNDTISRASQQLAVKSERAALDYGHLGKKVLDYSSFHYLQKRSKMAMYIINATILVNQLGSCAVPIVFVATNLNNLVSKHFHAQVTIIQIATIFLPFLILVNMIREIRIMSWLAIAATFLWFFGTGVMLLQCVQLPSQWKSLPATTDFWSTILFIGTAMYSYEGQTMILPIENKLRHPADFTEKCGVLPTVMILITVFYTAIGFYGYTAFGENILGTLPLNMPDTTLFTVVTIVLTIMAFLAHPVNMYVLYSMFWQGFKRKSGNRYPRLREYPTSVDVVFRVFWVLVTYLLAVSIPRIEQIVSLVGITAGSLCAFVYPPILEILLCWETWRDNRSKLFMYSKLFFDVILCLFGVTLLISGLYFNIVQMIRTF